LSILDETSSAEYSLLRVWSDSPPASRAIGLTARDSHPAIAAIFPRCRDARDVVDLGELLVEAVDRGTSANTRA